MIHSTDDEMIFIYLVSFDNINKYYNAGEYI